MVDESKLLMQLQKRQSNSLNYAIEVYTPYLSTVLYNMASGALSKEDVEEIIADVFVMLWKNPQYIDLTKGTLRSYIAAAARNLALKRLNKSHEYICIDDVELQDDSDFANTNSQYDELWSAVMSLGEPDNEIFIRFYKFDERLRDISKATGLKISTIKTKLSRGKQKLKKMLLNAEEEL